MEQQQQQQAAGAEAAAAPAPAVQLGQETVAFSALVKRTSEAAYTGLKELCESLPDQSDAERKIALLKYVLKTRQRLLRLLVISKWCRQIPLVQRCQQLVGTLSNHDVSFTQAADSMFYLHDGLLQSKAPMYDVPSAVEVLLTGSFRRMPKCMQDLASQPTLEGDKKEAALRTLDTVLRSKLLDVVIPKEFTRVSVQDGRVTLRVEGEFEVQLTLGYRGNASLWRVLNIELLVGERTGPAKLAEGLRLALADDLERRMAALQEPFHIIYSVLHEFCSDLVMDTFVRQVRRLQQGRWMDAIRLDLSVDNSQAAAPASDGDGDGMSSSKPVLGLKIIYWLELSKGAGPDSGLPSLRIEPGADQQLSCQHQPSVMDPYTESEADFALNQSCIDVESLILKAISCNIHTRLVEVQRSLKNNGYLCKVDGDVILRRSKQLLASTSAPEKLDDGAQAEGVLLVRAFADLYITLGISIRSGRFLIRAPESLLEKRVLQEMEEALNQGMSCVNVFVSLRTKSIIHHFAKLSTSMNLKVYEKGAISLKVPENGPKLGPDALILCFPNTGDLYFLVLHLDASFMPQFFLLEAQQQGAASVRSSREVTVSRFMNIDFGRDLLSKDDINLSLLTSKPAREPPSKDKGSEPKALHGPPSTHLRHAQSPYSSPSMRAGYTNQASIFHNRRSPSTQHLQSPARRSSSSSKLSDADYFRSRSPLHADNPTSPAVIDDDDLSKLIDSIDSVPAKTVDMGPRSSPVSRMVKSSSRSSLLMPSQKSSLPPIRKVPSEASLGSPAVKDSEDALHRLSSPPSSSQDKPQHGTKRKAGLDIFSSLPSLTAMTWKRPKTETSAQQSGELSDSFFDQPYVNIICAANQGKAPAVCYLAVFLHVVKRCWLMIKYARVTSQMRSLGISYIEEESTARLIFRLAPPSCRGDMAKYYGGWQRIQLRFGSLGSDAWEVKIRDAHYKSLWNLQKSKSAGSEWGSIQFAALSEADAHIKCCPDGLLLSYKSVEEESIKKLLVDLDRLRNARAFGLCMRKLLEPSARDAEKEDMKWEAVRRSFKVEAFGLTSLWFSYTGCMPGLFARFVVEWAPGDRDCTVHVSPEQLWPHTKYLEDYINGGDVELLLDAIRITAGPLHSLAGAIRPARMTTPAPNPAVVTPTRHSGALVSPQAAAQNTQQAGSMNVVPGRAGVVPTSLLPTDITVLMRTPYWIRIVYRKQFAVDMRCFEGDQVWLQPAPPPQGANPLEGGSFPCPQFRPFVMENVAVGLNNPETPFISPAPSGFAAVSQPTSSASSPARPSQQKGPPPKGTPPAAGTPGRSLVLGGPAGLYPGYKGELTAFCGMSDDGGYGGAWVPLATLKKVLRGTLKYLGILWLFAQFSPIIKDVLTSVMAWKEQHLHLDPEQPALRFNIGNCMFAVNMHRHQLYLQGINAKRYQQPHQQAAGQATGADSDLTSAEMSEITDFFARRVTAEPYDASRLASFVTVLTLPVSVLREFLALVAWKKEAQKAAQAQAVEGGNNSSSNSRPRIELRLENTVVIGQDEAASGSSVKSSITHDRERGIVEFALTVLLDLANVSVNVAGGAGWLPQCVSVRLRYHYNEPGGRLFMVGMEGSHGGRACWTRGDDWDRCKEKVASAVAEAAAAVTEGSARLRAVAESIQVTIQNALQQLRAG